MASQPATRINEISPFYVMELLCRAKHLESQGIDVIHMEIGEPDFPTPETIVASAIKHLGSGDVKYTAAAGLPALREKIAQFYRQRYGVLVEPTRIFITPGASGAFLLALGITVNPGDELLMSDPCYPCNSNFVKLFSGITKTIAVDATTHYQLTAELIGQHWSAQTKGAVLASPSNPTGTLIAPTALQQAIQAVNNLGGCFFSDEIYHGLVYGQDATTALKFSDDVFVINSFSKYFGMTGWRVGWLVVPEQYIAAAEKLAQNIFISTSTPAQYAALAAFDADTLQVLELRRTQLAERRDFLYDALVKLDFAVPIKPEGAFYIYVDCSKFTNDSFKFAADLLETEAVAVTPGKDFGVHHAHRALRFAYTTPVDRMALAMQRLQRFLDQGLSCR